MIKIKTIKNNKSFSVLVSLFLILFSVSIVTFIWYSISPIFYGLSDNILVEIGEGFSPSQNISLGENLSEQVNCELKGAYWSNETVSEGDYVNLIVEGGDCAGQTIEFEIREDDGIFGYDPIFINPLPGVFNGNSLIKAWRAEWQKDIFDPEYYFIAFAGNKTIKSELLSVSRSTRLSPLEVCKTIKDNGEGRVNIVIFADGTTANKYADYFLSSYPMSNNKDAFNIYYIDSYQLDCEIYKGIAMLCRSKDMIKKASSCPNDYIIAIKEYDSNIRSSAFLNIMSINSALPPTVLQHEFGHAFAGLAEEYAPAILPKNARNCAKNNNPDNPEEDCNYQFGPNIGIDRNGCYPECSSGDYYRSIDNGVMRTLSSEDYGLFNNKVILERLKESTKNVNINGGTLSLPSPRICPLEEYYLLEGNYDYITGNATLDRVTIEQGCTSGNGYGEIPYKIIYNSNVLVQGKLNPVYIFSDGVGEEGINGDINGKTYINNESFYLKVPADFADGNCGDNICNSPAESCSTCSQDCNVCPDYCGDNTCSVSESCSTCSSDCGPCACVPLTSCPINIQCGSVRDGCLGGGTLNCGSCPIGENCDKGKCTSFVKCNNNGFCELDENCLTCSNDCGVCNGGGDCYIGKDYWKCL